MGRPKTNTVEYFPMYVVPSRTLQILESKYGNDGFVFFYKLFQVLSGEDGHFYDTRNPVDMEFLARKCGVDRVSADKILDDLSLWGKIDTNLWQAGIIWYQGFVDTLKDVYKKRNRPIPTKEDVCKKTGISVEKTWADSSFCTENQEDCLVSGPESTQSKVKLKQSIVNKAAASPPIVPPDGGQLAAANKNLDALAFEDILDRVVEIRIQRSKRNGKPIKDPAKLRLVLAAACKKDPNEFESWKKEISAAEAKNAENMAKSEAALAEADQLEKERAERKRAMQVFETLPDEEKSELSDLAHDIELRDMDPELLQKGIKPARPQIESRVARLLRERGYLESEVVQ